MPKKKIDDFSSGVSQQQIEALARCLLPEIKKFFESEEGQHEYKEWKKKQLSESKPKE
jgi:hypothetical protein